MEEVKSVVFGSKPFAVDDVLKAIICVKKISDVNVVAALGWSLQVSFRFLSGKMTVLEMTIVETIVSVQCTNSR